MYGDDDVDVQVCNVWQRTDACDRLSAMIVVAVDGW
jgi:hypothetical protein